MADISITGHGSYQVESLTEAGAAWLWSNIAESEDEEDAVVVRGIGVFDAQDILFDAPEEGLEVEFNGRLYD